MNRLFVTGTLALVVVMIAACGSEDRESKNKSHKFGEGSTTYTDATPTPTPTPAPDTQSTPPPHTEVQNPNGGGDQTQHGEIPYATPVAGRPGFVTSPFAPYSGYVDVRGFPPGTEVKCPYTGKTFLVP